MLQLEIECLCEDVEEINAFLEDAGALSITLSDKQDEPILEPEPGTTPLWSQVIVQALFSEKTSAENVLQRVRARFLNLTHSLQPVIEREWERVCMDDFQPMRYGKRLWVCPSWCTPPDADGIHLTLDPGLAFGTGTHATTSLCLTWLEQAPLMNKSVIDYGCGSGILALAALKLGARHVHAVDIDDQALLATQSNASVNDVDFTQLTISQPDALQASADFVIANILFSPLLKLKNDFHERLKGEAVLVVSGILEEQIQPLIDAYQGHFQHQTTKIEDGWGLVVFKKS